MIQGLGSFLSFFYASLGVNFTHWLFTRWLKYLWSSRLDQTTARKGRGRDSSSKEETFLEGGHFSQKSPVICSRLPEPGFVTCLFGINQEKRILSSKTGSSFMPRVVSALEKHGDIMLSEENHAL